MGNRFMITADHPLAVQAGASVLEAGGNAMDAAICANLVLTVVRPHMSGMGGDLFALVYKSDTGALEALNASGRAPARATLDFFNEKGHDKIPEYGILTSTVPGAILGWQSALERHGTMGLDKLLARAIDYAEKGFGVYPDLQKAMHDRRPKLEGSKAAMDTFMPRGKVPEVGEVLHQPTLAKSYRLLADMGPDAFYKGPLGRALVEFSDKVGGLFSEEDLAAHTVNWLDPLKTGYRGYEICTQPPNSQGLALLLQANLLENFELGGLKADSPDLIHLMVEAKKLAFADRNAYVCDPEFFDIPLDKLLDKALAREQAARINPAKATAQPEPRRFTKGGDDTVYLAVVDEDGNAVSLIQSIYEAFGSCVMVPDSAMVLHNRGRGFSLDPHHPNCLAPGKRPYHTLHPAMILKDGKPAYVLGSPGADGQTQTVIQMTTAMLEFGADPQQAMEAPRWRAEPDGTLLMEGRFPSETIKSLEQKGHKIKVLDDWDEVMGSSQAISIKQNGLRLGGADPRRQAYGICR
jgi:gamma-glutamyltranspeptidase/glutathione hydrolase